MLYKHVHIYNIHALAYVYIHIFTHMYMTPLAKLTPTKYSKRICLALSVTMLLYVQGDILNYRCVFHWEWRLH